MPESYYVVMALAAAAAICKAVAMRYAKPGKRGSAYRLGWLDFYEPQGHLWVRVGRWLHFGAFAVFIGTWLYYYYVRGS